MNVNGRYVYVPACECRDWANHQLGAFVESGGGHHPRCERRVRSRAPALHRDSERDVGLWDAPKGRE